MNKRPFTQVQQQLTASDSPHSRSMDVNLARIFATVTENPPIFPTYVANPAFWHGKSPPAEYVQHLELNRCFLWIRQ